MFHLTIAAAEIKLYLDRSDEKIYGSRYYAKAYADKTCSFTCQIIFRHFIFQWSISIKCHCEEGFFLKKSDHLHVVIVNLETCENTFKITARPYSRQLSRKW